MKKTLTPLIGLITIAAFGVHASAQNLLNGGFELPVQTDPQGFTTLGVGMNPPGFAWTISSGNVDLVGDYFPAAEGNQCLDLTGYIAGSIYQDVTFGEGGIYRVMFQFSGNPVDLPTVKEMRVDFGPAAGILQTLGIFSFDTTGWTSSDLGWRQEQTPDFPVIAGVDYRLQFTSLVSGSYGPLLDDIRIVAVPEPDAGALLLVAIIGMAVPRKLPLVLK